MPAGRPSKYDPVFCQQLVDHMAEGASVTSFAAEIDVARSTINEWAEQHEEFSEALTRAKAKCLAWWEKVARSNAQNGTGSATMIVFGLKNMGKDDWEDTSKRELTGKDGDPLSIDLSGLSTEAVAAIASAVLPDDK